MIEFMINLPTWIKLILGLNLLWTSTFWVMPEPIVIVADTEYGAFNFANIVVLTSEIHDNRDGWRAYVLAHEYTHFIQSALHTPLINGPMYSIFTLYSKYKTGNQWDANPLENQATYWGHRLTFEPKFVLRF